jgi:hypothetical protein
MIFGFFLGILLIYILYKILDTFLKYQDNILIVLCLLGILFIYSIFLCKYIIWFSSWYSVKF